MTLTDEQEEQITLRAYGWRFGVGNNGQVRQAADDIYDLLGALDERDTEIADLRHALALSQQVKTRLGIELSKTRNVLAEAIIGMGGAFTFQPRLEDGEWVMSGPEKTLHGYVYRASWHKRSDPPPPGSTEEMPNA